MLVLSRKAGESILLHLRDGRTVDVKVTDIIPSPRGNRVKLGISAPDDVLILREEVPRKDEIRVFAGGNSDG